MVIVCNIYFYFRHKWKFIFLLHLSLCLMAEYLLCDFAFCNKKPWMMVSWHLKLSFLYTKNWGTCHSLEAMSLMAYFELIHSQFFMQYAGLWAAIVFCNVGISGLSFYFSLMLKKWLSIGALFLWSKTPDIF